jgi:predicted transcriptional regulator
MKQLEKLFKALANHRRLGIIRLLTREKELSVGEISKKIELSFKATSRHLRTLRQVDILDTKQEHLTVYYYLSPALPPLVKGMLSRISNSPE